MSLIAMAVFDTEENQRSKYTRVTLECLEHTVTDHRIIIVDNASCEETKELLKACPFEVITNTENVGTAKAINQAWAKREPKQHLIKMDNDVDINYINWVDEMEEAIERDPLIGILGLKRKDLMENPFRNDMYKSELRMLPHYKGQRWIIVEDVAHVIGTCQMYNYRLIDKIGGMMQPGIYGFDDTLAAVRCKVSGFRNSFLPHIEIDHIDTGENPYQKEKERLAGNDMAEFNRLKDDILMGRLNPYVAI
jgi:GT2 family glycosyltransferase